MIIIGTRRKSQPRTSFLYSKQCCYPLHSYLDILCTCLYITFFEFNTASLLLPSPISHNFISVKSRSGSVPDFITLSVLSVQFLFGSPHFVISIDLSSNVFSFRPLICIHRRLNTDLIFFLSLSLRFSWNFHLPYTSLIVGWEVLYNLEFTD